MFLGVDIKRFKVNIALINFKGWTCRQSLQHSVLFYENTQESFDELCQIITAYVDKLSMPKSKILSVGINISGRVNTQTGHSYSLYYFNERPLTEAFHERLGLHVTIDNDSRSMAYGEFMNGVVKGRKEYLFH